MTAQSDDGDPIDGLRDLIRRHGPEEVARTFAAVARTLVGEYADAVRRQRQRAAIRLVRDQGGR